MKQENSKLPMVNMVRVGMPSIGRIANRLSVMDRVTEILKKHSYQRTQEDLDVLIPYIKQDDFLNLVQCLQHEQYGDQDKIFDWGDYGDKFYVVLKGSIRVLIPSPKIKNSFD